MEINDIPAPGRLTRREEDLRKAFLASVHLIPGGEKIKSCIQCGTCTASCPVSYAMDITPREMIALFRAGDIDSIIRSRTIWICASCYACQTRCPSSIKVTDIAYTLKRMAMNRKVYNRSFPVYALSDSFIRIIKASGRLNEMRLMLRFTMRRGFWKGIPQIPLGIAMSRKRRLDLRSHRIKDLRGLNRIIEKAESLDMPLELAGRTYLKDAVGYKAIG
jgi:heterodisulfide reductase subunit C